MPQWKNTDDAANSVLWAPAQLKLAPTTTNRDALFGNTTSNAYFEGTTIGMFGVDDNEVAASKGAVAHTGWVLRTEGQGGRAGRIQTEVLVAGSMLDDKEDVVYPDAVIVIDTQPQSKTVEANTATTLSVVAHTLPPGVSISYQWQLSNGTSFEDLSNGGVYSGVTTATLTISDTTGLDGNEYRVVLSAPAAVNVESESAILSVE